MMYVKNFMSEDRYRRLFVSIFALSASLLFLYVIFWPPLTGVADQNDFSRMLYGIQYKDADHYYSVQKFTYVATEYGFRDFPFHRLVGMPPALSPIYFIFPSWLMSKLMGFSYFQMNILALLSGGTYIAVMSMLYAMLMPKRAWARILLGLGLLFFFFDGHWLMWFYSLYGEPYTLLGISLMTLCFISCLRRKMLPMPSLIGFGAACVLTVGAKMQSIILYPVCVGMLICIWIISRKNREKIKLFRVKTIICAAIIPVLLLYCFAVYKIMTGGAYNTNKETLYHSVMYGLLMEADDPVAVLDELELDRAFLEDIGKHSYLAKEDYAVAPPKTDIMEDMFFSKINNTTIVQYYLTHPSALLKGLEYLATKSYSTNSGLGKHTEDYPELVGVKDTVRFTSWSMLRNLLPKRLWFIAVVAILTLVLSIIEYKQSKKPICVAIWFLAAAGILQYPMPYLFNGHADTAKQLFGFNITFDIALFSLIGFAITLAVRFIASKRSEKAMKESDEHSHT